ncbi:MULTISPECIES: hypothetical protein [Bacillus cereus group]|uniref:hypothetical protein n=1 Tax=Bacillus cereus group TaxID=86661 RepID=UPI00159BAEAE|nr:MULTISPECIES: hypothetical protein [Bacillus cereus group]
MKKWEVEFKRSDGATGKILVKGEDKDVARFNANNKLAFEEPYTCIIQKITEVHK